jgi:hypothetical protein
MFIKCSFFYKNFVSIYFLKNVSLGVLFSFDPTIFKEFSMSVVFNFGYTFGLECLPKCIRFFNLVLHFE